MKSRYANLTDRLSESADAKKRINLPREGQMGISAVYGGRGLYFEDLDGNMLEMMTQPYGPRRMRWVDGSAVDEP